MQVIRESYLTMQDRHGHTISVYDAATDSGIMRCLCVDGAAHLFTRDEAIRVSTMLLGRRLLTVDELMGRGFGDNESIMETYKIPET